MPTNRYDPLISADRYAERYLDFTDSASTIFHAVDYVAKEYERAGFVEVSERQDWSEALAMHSKFFVVRDGTSIVGFVKGKHWKPSHGAAIIGSHMDSLCAVVKPISVKPPVEGYELLGVAPYGGAMNSLWWDRDLGIGGRMVVRKAGCGLTSKLVRIPHPVARISTLAPHFGVSGPFNIESQTVPVIGLTSTEDIIGNGEATHAEKKSPMFGRHSLRLLRALAKYGEVDVGDIVELELHMYSTEKGTFGGLDREFLYCPRVDDKACTYAAAQALIESADTVSQGDCLSFAVAYNFEEAGSFAFTGAHGTFLESCVERIVGPDRAKQKVLYANSFFLSADVTHAVNPCFADVYLENHKPQLNTGVTVKIDPNHHTITNSISAAFVEELARKTGNTLQRFHIRNDSRSGGTIGPTLAAKLGVRGVDVGIPQLSMHTIRACFGAKDIWLGVRFFKSFFIGWRDIDEKFERGGL